MNNTSQLMNGNGECDLFICVQVSEALKYSVQWVVLHGLKQECITSAFPVNANAVILLDSVSP